MTLSRHMGSCTSTPATAEREQAGSHQSSPQHVSRAGEIDVEDLKLEMCTPSAALNGKSSDSAAHTSSTRNPPVEPPPPVTEARKSAGTTQPDKKAWIAATRWAHDDGEVRYVPRMMQAIRRRSLSFDDAESGTEATVAEEPCEWRFSMRIPWALYTKSLSFASAENDEAVMSFC